MGMRTTLIAVAGALLGLASFTVLPVAGSFAAPAVETKSDSLALEPIGGYTELANVRIITTQLCPERSEVIIARISGAGFEPDSNVFGNTELALVPKMPDGSGYVAPIFADWDYLASAHDAETPLNGRAELTLLCADKDLERIDARMEGAVRFESEEGERSTYLQDGGPRIASGLPGVPAPGNGGIPEDAPTAAPVLGVVGTADSDLPGSQPGGASTSDAEAAGGADGGQDGEGNDAQSQGKQLTASDGGGPGARTGLVALGGVALLLIAGVGYVFTRRPSTNSGFEG